MFLLLGQEGVEMRFRLRFFFWGGGEGKGSRADTHASRHARNRDERVANLDPQDTD